jgi:hypothetical protein
MLLALPILSWSDDNDAPLILAGADNGADDDDTPTGVRITDDDGNACTAVGDTTGGTFDKDDGNGTDGDWVSPFNLTASLIIVLIATDWCDCFIGVDNDIL